LKKLAVRSSPDPAKIGFSPDPVRYSRDPCSSLLYWSYFAQGCQIFFAANGQNGCFLKNLWPKSQNVLTMVISIFIGVSNCLEGSIFFAKKSGFAKEASFYLKAAISAVNLKLPVTTCLYLI